MPKYRTVEGNGGIITSKSLEGGEVFEGIYKGSREGEFDNLLHDIIQLDGKKITLAGCGALDYKLASCGTDVQVRLTYCGKEALTSGKRAGTLAHNWSVELAEPDDVTTSEEIPF